MRPLRGVPHMKLLVSSLSLCLQILTDKRWTDMMKFGKHIHFEDPLRLSIYNPEGIYSNKSLKNM
jgi:hypothetical protein